MMKKTLFILIVILLTATSALSAEYLGQYTVNKYATDSVYNNGNAYRVNMARQNSYSTSEVKLYNSEGEFRGNLNNNRYDPDSISNPYGRYGSKYSADSINNPYGAGSKYNTDSPFNKYGNGFSVYGE